MTSLKIVYDSVLYYSADKNITSIKYQPQNLFLKNSKYNNLR